MASKSRLPAVIVLMMSVSFFIILLAKPDYATSISVPANATIPAFVSVGLSSDLSAGVLFGSLSPDTDDNSATGNYANLGNSAYYIYALDGNTDVDFCISDNAPLTSAEGVTIGNGNYTFNDSSAQNGPSLPGNATSMSYQKLSQQGVAQNTSVYLRFWLDIPANQPAGNYNNTIRFKIVVAGETC